MPRVRTRPEVSVDPRRSATDCRLLFPGQPGPAPRAYRSDELDATYVVAIADGRAVVRWPRNMDGSVLEAVGADRFLSRTLGVVAFTRNGSKQIDGMTISNGRVRRLPGAPRRSHSDHANTVKRPSVVALTAAVAASR